MLGVNRDTVIIHNGKLVRRFWRQALSRSGEQPEFSAILS